MTTTSGGQEFTGLIARKDGAPIRLTHVSADQFAEYGAKIGCHRQIASFKELLSFEAGPLAGKYPMNTTSPQGVDGRIVVA
jgi:hypothetical protein